MTDSDSIEYSMQRKINDLQAEVKRLRDALLKIRDHKSPYLGLRDSARWYIATQALEPTKRDYGQISNTDQHGEMP